MDEKHSQGPVFLIEVDKIKPNPYQPRRNFKEEELKELANSIREFGILQPVVVTKLEKETELGTDVEYQLIAGERRLLASKLIGLERIPAIIRNIDLDRERLELAIVENVQRADLDPIESAKAYAKLQDNFGLTQREIAAKIGKSREAIANTMRLLSLPESIQKSVSEGRISESQARLLLTVSDLAKQQALFEDLLKNNTSVRDLRSKIRRIQNDEEGRELKSDATAQYDPETKAFTNQLEEFLGAKVNVQKSGDSGKITISFHSPEELQNILDKLLEKERIAELDNPTLSSDVSFPT